jgi:hypothetical protein
LPVAHGRRYRARCEGESRAAVGAAPSIAGQCGRSQGPFATDGEVAVAKLKAFREHEALRTVLCHGKGKVLIDCSGRWTLVLTNVEITNRKPTRHERVIHEADAGALIEALRQTAQQLCAALGTIPKR